MKFTADQIASYKTNGYLILNDLMPAAMRDEVMANASRLAAAATFAEDTPIVKWDQRVVAGEVKLKPEDRELGVFKLHHPYKHDAWFRDLLNRMPELPGVRQLLGNDLYCITQQLVMKPSGHGQWQPYHQDAFYFEYTPSDGCASWTALDAATVANGCLWIRPGSHLGPILNHDVPKDVNNLNKGFLEAEGIARDSGIPVELPAGSAVLFHNKLLHMSGPNNSPQRRRALVTHYASTHWTYTGDIPTERIA